MNKPSIVIGTRIWSFGRTGGLGTIKDIRLNDKTGEKIYESLLDSGKIVLDIAENIKPIPRYANGDWVVVTTNGLRAMVVKVLSSISLEIMYQGALNGVTRMLHVKDVEPVNPTSFMTVTSKSEPAPTTARGQRTKEERRALAAQHGYVTRQTGGKKKPKKEKKPKGQQPQATPPPAAA